MGGVEQEARLHRQALVQPGPRIRCAQLVGLLAVDRVTRLPEGSQIVEFCTDDALPPPPVPMLGHVTSSYRSAELGRTFALALLDGGRDRVGEVLDAVDDLVPLPVRVTGPVSYDEEGARRDG